MRLGAPRPAAGPGPRGGRHTCTIALAHQIKGQEHDFACAWAARLWALVAPTREVLDTDSLDFGYYDIMLAAIHSSTRDESTSNSFRFRVQLWPTVRITHPYRGFTVRYRATNWIRAHPAFLGKR